MDAVYAFWILSLVYLVSLAFTGHLGRKDREICKSWFQTEKETPILKETIMENESSPLKVDTSGRPCFTPEQNLRLECLKQACIAASGIQVSISSQIIVDKARKFEVYIVEGY